MEGGFDLGMKKETREIARKIEENHISLKKR